MTDAKYSQTYGARQTLRHAITSLTGSPSSNGEMADGERDAVIKEGNDFAKQTGKDVWLLISGEFAPHNDETTENQVKESLRCALGYPNPDQREQTINVLLDSLGGSLDSAFRTVLYLSCYAKELNVYVPRRAKSASTLVALGANHAYLSTFGELGPLDTQIDNPRNPAKTISALDCYQSVDYVRQFGIKTLTEVLTQLVNSTEGRIALTELLETASKFALGSISPILQNVSALDFGGWGRSLKIGEQYARALLLAKNSDQATASRIAEQLVYGYTHHPFPIDYDEAVRIGLGHVARMDKGMYDEAIKVVQKCHEKNFVGFISEEQSDKERAKRLAESKGMTDGKVRVDRTVPVEHLELKAGEQNAVPKAQEPG